MRLEIAHKVAIEHELLSDVAREYRVTTSCISRIVSKMRQDPSDIVLRIEKDTDKALTDETLAAFVDAKLMRGELIVRAEDIQRDFEAKTGLRLKVYRVRRVMHELLGLGYKKIVPIPVHGNSERCLVQR